MGINFSLGDSATKYPLERSYQRFGGVSCAFFELSEFIERDTQGLIRIAIGDRQFAQSFVDISIGFLTKIALRHFALFGSLVG